MIGKIYFTKQELIAAWLRRYPHDDTSPDLEINAIGGYVETRHGFIIFSNWKIVRASGATHSCLVCAGHGNIVNTDGPSPVTCGACKGQGVI